MCQYLLFVLLRQISHTTLVHLQSLFGKEEASGGCLKYTLFCLFLSHTHSQSDRFCHNISFSVFPRKLFLLVFDFPWKTQECVFVVVVRARKLKYCVFCEPFFRPGNFPVSWIRSSEVRI